MKSRSIRSGNTIVFRHPLMFSSAELDAFKDEEGKPLYQDWNGKLDQYAGRFGQPATEGDGDPERDCYWIFRKTKLAADGEIVSQALFANRNDLAARVEQAIKDGEEPDLDDADRLTYQRAELTAMTVKHVGKYFTVPPDYTLEDETGSGDEEEANTPHPLAGQPLPDDDPSYLRFLDDALLDAASARIREEQRGRTPQQEESFPTGAIPALPTGQRPGRKRAGGKRPA